MLFIEMIEKIKTLKKKYNATIIAHYYAPIETHEICDFLSDSHGFFFKINGNKQ